MLRKMALMGMSVAMLYTEDTYEIPQQPYFGYLRGRYTQQQLRELDRYAADLGIELIPCIQTLAHLERALHWPQNDPDLRDTEDCLMVGRKRYMPTSSRCSRLCGPVSTPGASTSAWTRPGTWVPDGISRSTAWSLGS